MTTPWAIPGILSPSLKLTLERSAPVGTKKDPLPFSGYNLRKDVGGKDYSRTAAAASSCVGVLRRIVIDQDTAVFMNGRKPDILFLQKIQENFLPDDPQIPGKDGIIIRRRPPEIRKSFVQWYRRLQEPYSLPCSWNP